MVNRYAFLITGDRELLLQPAWGMNEREAKTNLERLLNSYFSIVEDDCIIERFIEEEEKDLLNFIGPATNLLDDYTHDLAALKQSLIHKRSEKKMDIELQMNFIRMALEMGARIDVYFHGIEERKEAKKIADTLAELSGFSVDEKLKGNTKWFELSDKKRDIDISVFYQTDSFMEEDVDLNGGEEIA